MAVQVDTSGYAYDPSTGYESDTAASGFSVDVPGNDPISAGSSATGSGLFSAIGSVLNSVPGVIKAINPPSPAQLSQYSAAGYRYNPTTGTYVPTAGVGLSLSNLSPYLLVGAGILVIVFLMRKA